MTTISGTKKFMMEKTGQYKILSGRVFSNISIPGSAGGIMSLIFQLQSLSPPPAPSKYYSLPNRIPSVSEQVVQS